jgi:hypothetical protein
VLPDEVDELDGEVVICWGGEERVLIPPAQLIYSYP